MEQPLDGIRVIEWGAYHAGPGGTAILAALAAVAGCRSRLDRCKPTADFFPGPAGQVEPRPYGEIWRVSEFVYLNLVPSSGENMSGSIQWIGRVRSTSWDIGGVRFFRRPWMLAAYPDHLIVLPYLVGGGTHPGSGLPTIYESARISANLISKKHGVDFTPPSPLPTKTTFS